MWRLEEGSTWYFQVRAYNDIGASDWKQLAQPATTPLSPDIVDTPKDHLAVAVQKNGSNAVAGTYYSFEYDGIGNRTKAVGRSNYGGATTYTHYKLNQIAWSKYSADAESLSIRN